MADEMKEMEPKKRGRGRPKKEATPSQDSVPMSVFASVLERLTALQEQQTTIAQAQLKNAPRRKKTLNEYRAEKGPQKRLIRPTFQNFRLIDAHMLTWEAIEKLDSLAPGNYLGGLRIARVGEGVESRIHLLYPGKSIEQRMAFYMMYPSMNKLADTVLEQMAKRGVAPIFEERPPVVDDFTEEEETVAPVVSEAERAAMEREATSAALREQEANAKAAAQSQASAELQQAMRSAGLR
jgi:hypothetical protein